jgi:hypothetical protein
MGVQEQSYLAERPIDEPEFRPVANPSPVITLEIRDLQKQIEQITNERNDLQKQQKQAAEKVKEMHLAAMCRPEVAELIGAIETALVALASVRLQEGCERSRQILCGVHETLQKTRLNQGAAGRLPAAKIASAAMFKAYYESCSDRLLNAVQKFVE